jgi:hypothetical protein
LLFFFAGSFFPLGLLISLTLAAIEGEAGGTDEDEVENNEDKIVEVEELVWGKECSSVRDRDEDKECSSEEVRSSGGRREEVEKVEDEEEAKKDVPLDLITGGLKKDSGFFDPKQDNEEGSPLFISRLDDDDA